MKEMLRMLLVAPVFLLQLQAADSMFRIPDNAAQELPAGVPRTVDTNGHVIFIDGTFTTKAYQEEALRLVIEEANKVAQEMQLPEPLPITESNLTHAYIGPFGYNYQLRGLGNITTSNYWYHVNQGYKFSGLTIANYDGHCFEYRDKYKWPVSRIDTNAAYQLAIQWLADAHMDVESLNRDCQPRVAVSPFWNRLAKLGDKPLGQTFVPIYYVWWTPAKPRRNESGGANVELLLPTKTLVALNVEDPKYILRKPVVFTNLAVLFPGKAVITTNLPVKPRFIAAPRP